MTDDYSLGKDKGSFGGFCWEMDRGHFDSPAYNACLTIVLTKISEQNHEEFIRGFKDGWEIGVDAAEDYMNPQTNQSSRPELLKGG